MEDARAPRWRLAALAAGPLLGLAPLLLPAPGELSLPAWRLVGMTLWMVVWWLSEAVPIPATALLPIPLAPLLGVAPEGEVAASYAHPLIFLFLGGFVLAGAMRRSGLHRRIALAIVRRVGSGPAGLVGGFMAATAFLSMWISNTATAILMFTIGLSLLDHLAAEPGRGGAAADPEHLRRFGRALMLGIAYGASLGGAATLIGTPTNALLASFLDSQYGYTLTFRRWLALGLPFTLVMLPLAWLWLTRGAFRLGTVRLPDAGAHLAAERARLGRPSRAERFVAAVFAATAAGWVLRDVVAGATGWTLTDTTVAMVGALIVLVVPLSLERGAPALDWQTVEELPWGVLLLFGGGLALAASFRSSGLAEALGRAFTGLGAVPPWLLVLAVIAMVVALTELTSNTATAATFLPILAAVAVGLGESPLLLTVPVALAASAAFMLPVATPPNAIVFGYPEMRIAVMARAGLVMNLLAIAAIWLVVYLLGRPLLSM